MPPVGWVSKRMACPFVAFCMAMQMLLALTMWAPETGASLSPANATASHAVSAGAADATGHPCDPPENQCHTSPHCNPVLPAVQQTIALAQDREPAVTFHRSLAELIAAPASRPPLVVSA